MIVPDLATLGLFALTFLLLCLFGLTASSMFPAEHRPPVLQGLLGAVLLYAGILMVAALAVQLLRLAIGGLAWEVALVAAGLVFLFAPALHQILPDRLRSGALGFVTFAATGLVLHLAIWAALPSSAS